MQEKRRSLWLKNVCSVEDFVGFDSYECFPLILRVRIGEGLDECKGYLDARIFSPDANMQQEKSDLGVRLEVF